MGFLHGTNKRALSTGVDGLMHPHGMESLGLAIGVLTASFVSESVTLALAIRSIRESAAESNMTFFEYVVGGFDPCVNVVLLEDTAGNLITLIFEQNGIF